MKAKIKYRIIYANTLLFFGIMEMSIATCDAFAGKNSMFIAELLLGGFLFALSTVLWIDIVNEVTNT